MTALSARVRELPQLPEAAGYCCPSDPFNSTAFSWPGSARVESRHTDPIYTADQMHAYAEQAIAERLARVEGLEAAILQCVPSNWCDPLLTGPNAALRGESCEWSCPDIERLLNGIRERLTAALPPPPSDSCPDPAGCARDGCNQTLDGSLCWRAPSDAGVRDGD